MWLMVFARGLMMPLPDPILATLPDTEFLRTRAAELGGKPVVLSRRALRGRVVVAPCWCSFCWCRNSKSRRAKHLVHCGHSKGFSLVCDRSWRFRCSRRANDRVQVVQTWGLGLSVLGGGKLAVVGGCEVSGFAVCTEAGALLVGPRCGAHESVSLTVAASTIASRIVARCVGQPHGACAGGWCGHA
jgi:hypothetical protein